MKLYKEQLDLFYKENKGFKSFVKSGLRKVKEVSKAALAALAIVPVTYACISALPTESYKTSGEVQNAVDLLQADDTYGSLVNSQLYKELAIKTDKQFYLAPALPSNKDSINIVYDEDFSDVAMDAISDTIDEYNEVLQMVGKEYSLNLSNKGNLGLYDIELKVSKDFKKGTAGYYTAINLAKGQRINAKVTIYKAALDTEDYGLIRTTFTHELAHYFGLGDLYVYEGSGVDSIMSDAGIAKNAFLTKNDLKLMYAYLGDVKTPNDAKIANEKIDEHIEKYKSTNYHLQRLKNNFGDKLTSQIKEETGKDVTLNAITDFKDLYLMNRKYSNFLSLYFDTKDYYGLRFSDNSNYVFSNTNSKQNAKGIGSFYYDNILADCGDFYASFDNKGNLTNLFKDVSKETYKTFETDTEKVKNIKELENQGDTLTAFKRFSDMALSYYKYNVEGFNQSFTKDPSKNLDESEYVVNGEIALSKDKKYMVVNTNKGEVKFDLIKLSQKTDSKEDFSDYFTYLQNNHGYYIE